MLVRRCAAAVGAVAAALLMATATSAPATAVEASATAGLIRSWYVCCYGFDRRHLLLAGGSSSRGRLMRAGEECDCLECLSLLLFW